MMRIALLVLISMAPGLAAACTGDEDASPVPTGTALPYGAAAAAAVLNGGAPGEGESASLEIAAASDLRPLIEDLVPVLERRCGATVSAVFGSSGQLKSQVEAGAPFDLFLSADQAYPLELLQGGHVAPNGVAAYAVGRIVVATRPGLEPVRDPGGLVRSDIRTIAMANPAHAPYGRAAEQALRSAGIYDTVRDRLVLGENIRQATDYVARGDADAGIVALSLAINQPSLAYSVVDASLHEPIVQAGAVIEGTGAERTARCVLHYLLTGEGQAALARFGFEPVEGAVGGAR
jgi:molybdate transport system substrate-binding protein